MTVETEVATLTQSVDALTSAVNVKKATLDASVTNASNSASSAETHKNNTSTLKSETSTLKDAAVTAANSASTAAASAYQDLTAIAESKSVTATDVFVYDTSKDSDGGAWRNRTQGTSWYNEALNTSYRGATKKFPAVAVIVAHNGAGNDGGVDIYDATDPDCPLWMRFQGDYSYGSGKMLIVAGRPDYAQIRSVTMKDAKLYVGSSDVGSSASGLHEIDFIKEQCLFRKNGNSSYNVVLNHPNIAARNENLGITPSTVNNVNGLVNQFINDIAVTVLPNAPIDPDTGLPVPTIAVATDGGVSVIKDDGTVWDMTRGANESISDIAFNGDNNLVIAAGVASGVAIAPIPTADVVSDTSYGGFRYYSGTVPSIKESIGSPLSYNGAVGHTTGLTILNDNPTNPSEGSVAYITSDFNTGWMVGDIKLAALSDTDDTDVVGSELVTNATDRDFSGSLVNWSGTISSSGGVGVLSGSTASASLAVSGLTIGQTYILSFDIPSITTGTPRMYITGGDTSGINYSTGGSTRTFTAGATSITVVFYVNGAGSGNYQLDNVSVRLAEPDRSVNANGLNIVGTVTKSAVATGAELVGYKGFGGANRLEQPYNSDLDFGEGEDFCIMSWAKLTDGNNQSIFSRQNINAPTAYGSGAYYRLVKSGSNNEMRYQVRGTDGVQYNVTSSRNLDESWHQVIGLRRDGVLELYIDGKLESTQAHTASLANSDGVLRIGGLVYGGTFYGDSASNEIALFRISATAPTAEQIAKIYRDEKPLFQEGAKCTLYGSSDAVTALAYDDATELLHVGTSAGRSEFSGLQRVSNTTDAVGTAISASSGLVAEE